MIAIWGETDSEEEVEEEEETCLMAISDDEDDEDEVCDPKYLRLLTSKPREK